LIPCFLGLVMNHDIVINIQLLKAQVRIVE